jgi:multimeric flavodoxin WrbA
MKGAPVRLKKVLGIIGSPRRHGNTHLLVDRILKGAADAGAITETIFLADLLIGECDGCHACWRGGLCCKQDDMHRVYASVSASDVIVFGTPVYWYGPTALMKACFDRFVLFNCPRNRPMIHGRKAITAIPFEETDSAIAEDVVSFFEKSLAYLNMNLLGQVLAPGVTRRGEVADKTEYLQAAYELGKRSVG